MPLVAAPWGHTHWTVETGDGSWFFDPKAETMRGFRATHQPSPWMGDWAALTFLPYLDTTDGTAHHHDLLFFPDRMETCLDGGLSAEVEAFALGAVLRTTSPFSLRFSSATGPVTIEPREAGVVVHLNERQPAWYAFLGGEPTIDGTDVHGWEEEVRIGVSFVDAASAVRHALDPGRSAADWWAEIFGRFRLEGDERDRRTFATCLYRAHLFPRDISEPDPDGGERHRSPYNGEVRKGPGMTDNGFWDTYRTVYPFLALVHPERLARILEGWTDAARAGGWFPQWASPGYRACMVGTHIDAVFADAAVKGIPIPPDAFGYLKKHTVENGDDAGSYGRRGIEEYRRQGWVPEGRTDHSVARTLDYAYDDWCLARLAEVLGEDPAEFDARIKNYRHLWDPETGFFRGRDVDGKWIEPWSPFRWGGPYVEGSAWQTAFAVPHDPDGLAELHGGREACADRLLRSFSMERTYEVGSYGGVIHEMVEMAAVPFGQYAHSNQPVHHHLALLARLGRRNEARALAHRVLRELYDPETGFCGDEDNGEMACWYLLTSLGVYPLCPGDPRFETFRPLFTRAEIDLPAGTLTIEPGDGPDSVTHATLAAGGRVVLG